MRRVISLLPGLAMAALLAGCDRQNPPAPQGNGANDAAAAPAAPDVGNASAHAQYPTGRLDRSKGGTPAPAVAFQRSDGGQMRLSAFRGRPRELWPAFGALLAAVALINVVGLLRYARSRRSQE